MNFWDKVKSILFYSKPPQRQRFVLPEKDCESDPSNLNKDNTPADNDIPAAGNKVRLRKRISAWLRGTKRELPPASPTQKLSKNIQINQITIKHEFNSPLNQDFIIREFKVMRKSNAFIAYIEGITDPDTIDNFIMRQLLGDDDKLPPGTNIINYITDNLLAANQTTVESDYDRMIRGILRGQTALVVDGYAECILIDTVKFEKRAVSTPLQEFVVLGPNEALIEDMRTNITLIRQIIRNQNLITEILTLTDSNNTKCSLLYVKDIINPLIVTEVKRRLQNINLDHISDGILSQLIEDNSNALLPQVLKTERPDVIAMHLMDGRAAVVLEGTPMALIVPMTLFNFFDTAEDFSLRWQYSTFLRLIRLFAATAAILLPAFYIAVTLYHQEAIPVNLLFSIVQSRASLPFPAALELLLMEVSWELIREAGLRVPGVVGQTLGIVGGVILGQAAVAAGLVSPILIIIVAITGLGNFAIPNFSIAFGFRVLRFVFFFLGAVAGFYGLAVGIVVLGAMACSMKSVGVPYMSPVAPRTKGRPVIFTLPPWRRTERPDVLTPQKREKRHSVVRGWKQQEKKDRSRNDD